MTPEGLAAYLARIGLEDAPGVDAAGLARVQRAHRLAVPFENLDIPLGRGISLAPEAVAAKLVVARRGGYCFEQNGLFLAALGAMGFVARPLLARVWLGVEGVPPRTHMLVAVRLGARDWIADVGFGGSFTPPMVLEDGAGAATPDGARHRLRRAAMPGDPDGAWLLERDGAVEATDGRVTAGNGWQPQYGFGLGGVTAADIEMCNHWTATRPATRFTTLCVASRVLADGFAALTDRRLVVYRGGASEARMLEGAEAYRAALGTVFGILLTEAEVAALPLFTP